MKKSLASKHNICTYRAAGRMSFAAYLKAESERWGPVIRSKNIKAD
jgi:hypothetical protein